MSNEIEQRLRGMISALRDMRREVYGLEDDERIAPLSRTLKRKMSAIATHLCQAERFAENTIIQYRIEG